MLDDEDFCKAYPDGTSCNQRCKGPMCAPQYTKCRDGHCESTYNGKFLFGGHSKRTLMCVVCHKVWSGFLVFSLM